MKTTIISCPDTVIEAYAGIALWKAKAGVAIVGVVSETERHLIQRTVVEAEDVYRAPGLLAEAIASSPVPVARIGLRYTARLDETMELADALSRLVPVSVMKAAKEDVDEPRPLLWSKFDRKIANVGMVTARRIASQTVLGDPIGPEDPALYALAAEEYQRRHRRFRRQKAPTVRLVPDLPSDATVARRIADLEATVAAQEEMIRRLTQRTAA